MCYNFDSERVLTGEVYPFLGYSSISAGTYSLDMGFFAISNNGRKEERGIAKKTKNKRAIGWPPPALSLTIDMIFS